MSKFEILSTKQKKCYTITPDRILAEVNNDQRTQTMGFFG